MDGKGNIQPKNQTASQSSPTDIVRKPRALVVDDVYSNRKLCGKLMERIGFEVELADNGLSVVELCDPPNGSIYDLIAIDNIMPTLTGSQAVKTLRVRGYKGIIFGITGNCMEADLLEFRDAGCDAVFTKPLDTAAFRAALKEYKIIS
jgi:CheY-like chemotaxis protein